MQIGLNNINRRSSPNFGKVVKFENKFVTYNDIDKNDYLNFVDTFRKSKQIKDYCSKHDVSIEFSEESSRYPNVTNLNVYIRDLNLDPDITFNHVLFITGHETRVKGQEKSPFQDLTEQILKLKPNALEKKYKEAKEYGDKKIEENAKNYLDIRNRERYETMMNEKINKGLDEINNW